MKRLVFLVTAVAFIAVFPQGNAYAGGKGGGGSGGTPVTLVKNNDMNFGFLDYDVTHSGTLQLGTNGALVLSGSTGLSSDGSGQAGSVLISHSTGVVDIKCTDTGKLKNLNGNESLDIQNAEIEIDTGTSFGSGLACQGTKNNSPVAASVDLAANPNAVILMGAEVVITSGSLGSGTFTTNTGGGTPITLSVVFQ